MPTENPMPVLRMMGRKYAMAYVVVVVRPKSAPKARIFRSHAPLMYLPRLKGSSTTSWRSFSILAHTKATSFSFKNGSEVLVRLAASSGKSTMVKAPMAPTATVMMPCMMKIQRQPAIPDMMPLGAVGLSLVGP